MIPSVRAKAAKTQRKRADAEIDACIANETLFGFRKIVAHAPWQGHLRQVVVECKCGKREAVKYAWLKHKVRLGKMRQCHDCGNDGRSGANSPWFSGGGRRGEGVYRATNKYKRFHPNCERCGSSVNVHVDHKEPVSRRPDLALCESNFESLCSVCHAEKTLQDGMGHVVPMLLAGSKSTAVPSQCRHCLGPMFFYPGRASSPTYCSRKCHFDARRKVCSSDELEIVALYLAGGTPMATINKKYGLSGDHVRKILFRNGVDRRTILAIGDANRNQAKRALEARQLVAQQSKGRRYKLDEDKVRTIKRLLASQGLTQLKIAQDFGVCAATIGHIASGLNWSWVTI